METSWIMVADAARARVLARTDHSARLEVVHKLENPAGRLRTQEIVSDEAGRIEKSGQGVLSAMDPRSNPHDLEAFRFAQRLAGLLEGAAARKEYTRLTLVAPPRFLGLLRPLLSEPARKRLVTSSRRDLTRLQGRALLQHLRNLGV